MRLTRLFFPLFLFATTLLPSRARAQDPTPPPTTAQPPATPPPAAKAPAAAKPALMNNYWFTLSASASQPNDSFSDKAEMGSQFLGGVHFRLAERVTLGLDMGASNWTGADIESYHSIQVTLDARFYLTRWSSRFVPYVQLGGGSYQIVSEVEPIGAEPKRASENAWGLNYGGGLLFSVGKTAKLGPVVTYHTAGSIPEIGTLVGQGDCKFISFGVELVMPMGR